MKRFEPVARATARRPASKLGRKGAQGARAHGERPRGVGEQTGERAVQLAVVESLVVVRSCEVIHAGQGRRSHHKPVEAGVGRKRIQILNRCRSLRCEDEEARPILFGNDEKQVHAVRVG